MLTNALSHERMTPLNSIINTADRIKRDCEKELQKSLVGNPLANLAIKNESLNGQKVRKNPSARQSESCLSQYSNGGGRVLPANRV
jgi:hypothetical protein